MPRPPKKTDIDISKLRDIEEYTHDDKQRTNNPPVGMAQHDKSVETVKTYQFDPHLDPTLQWAGKAEGMSFDVPTSSIHIHESIKPHRIISSVQTIGQNDEALEGQMQMSFFEDPLARMRRRQAAIQFYQHGVDWTNRMIAGDSLVIMNSLLEKEGMAGQVQMVYIDPPYGIKYGSNFQPFVDKRDVKQKDEDLSQEPEMIKAFRDTWELGIHSYLTYLRNRLLLANQLLSDSGSVFIQISEENVHLVRIICDEIFGIDNFVAQISFRKKTMPLGASYMEQMHDYIVFYAKNKALLRFAGAYREIEKRLSRIDFPLLFHGFHRFPFALYDETRAYLDGEMIDKPAGFLGNTSILFRGMHTAIWNLADHTMDFDTLTAKVVHEMLHAFQNASGETRWADERAALVKYRYEAANISARIEEAEAMEKCLSEYAPDVFSRLLALRRARADRFPFAYDYESRIEQIEGSAHFVELAALAQLDPEKAALCWKRLFSELSDPARYFPVRAVTYLSGAAFIACLRKYTSLDTDTFADTPFSVEAIAGTAPCALPEPGARVRECMDEWNEKTRARIKKTLEKGELVLDGDYRLFAFNVYDALWDGRYAVLSGFIGYTEGTVLPATDKELFSMMKILNGDFIAQLDENMYFCRLWRQ